MILLVSLANIILTNAQAERSAGGARGSADRGRRRLTPTRLAIRWPTRGWCPTCLRPGRATAEPSGDDCPCTSALRVALHLSPGVASRPRVTLTRRFHSGKRRDLPELGLMGTIPIYWGESCDSAKLLAGGHRATHWARAQLEARHRLRPARLRSSGESLAGLDFLHACP